MYKLVTTNPMMNKTKKQKLRSVKCHTDGMMSSSTSVMIISWRKLLNKRLLIKFNNSSKSHKIKIGGEQSETSLTWEISNSQTNNLKSLTESEAVKWPPRPLPLLTTHTNCNITTPCHFTHTHQAKETSCHQNGSKWKLTRFLMGYWVEE